MPRSVRAWSTSGFVEGRNLAIVHRSAESELTRLPALADELVRIPVVAIAALGGDSSTRAAKAATSTIPIVFTTAADPVERGIVASLNRPSGNITGVWFLGSLVAAKQVGLLRDVVPKLATIGLLTSPFAPSAAEITRDVEAVARTLGIKAVVVSVNDDGQFDNAFAQFAEQRTDALVISAGVFFTRHRDRLIALAARHAIPAIAPERSYAAAGGLMSYGADIGEAYRQAGVYVARILRGDKPSDLPIMQATRFPLVINMKTAKSLGLAVPSGVIAIADELIE